MRTFHKNSKQSLRPSTGRVGCVNFRKLAYFVKQVPNFDIGWPAPATPAPRAQNIKAVYVVSHSWYVQIIVPVCKY